TKLWTREELESLGPRLGFRPLSIDRAENSWSTELERPPRNFRAPYPWDWLAVLERAGERSPRMRPTGNPSPAKGVPLAAAAGRAKQKEFLFTSCTNYYQEPIVPAEGRGTRVKDLDGREYLDFFGGILTLSVGHAHPKVNAALKAQIDRIGHVSSLYPHVEVVRLAATLARIHPGRLKKTYFVASGTEADETAVTLAQVFTGALEIIALRHGYSG